MPNSLVVLGRQLTEIWKHFGVNQKFSAIMGLLTTVAVIFAFVYWGSRPSFRLLYSGMTMQDAAAARERLEENNIPVELKQSGTSIYVPAGDVYKCRLMLAEEGIPRNASPGFELFEAPKFGLTDFAQKVNYQRALQGELEQTISAMDGINSARVMLVLPKERLFSSKEEQKASASVMLNLAGGADISPAKVRSVKQLIASAVSTLSPSAIAVTDQYGNILSKSSGGVNEEEIAGEQLEARERLENALTLKAQAMLDTALGREKSIVRVSAVMDFSQIETKKETIDSEGRVVISENISSENTSTPQQAAPVSSTSVLIGNPGAAGATAQASTTKKEDIVTEYIAPKGVMHTVEKGARIKNLSVSVCVAKNENPRTPQELSALTNMVQSAVGLVRTAERSDSIQVVEMAFPEKKEEETKVGLMGMLPFSLKSMINGVAGIVLLVVVFIVSKRMFANLTVHGEDAGTPLSMVGGMAASASMMPVGEGGELTADIGTVTRLAEHNPKAIAAWITSVTKGK